MEVEGLGTAADCWLVHSTVGRSSVQSQSWLPKVSPCATREGTGGWQVNWVVKSMEEDLGVCLSLPDRYNQRLCLLWKENTFSVVFPAT